MLSKNWGSAIIEGRELRETRIMRKIGEWKKRGHEDVKAEERNRTRWK